MTEAFAPITAAVIFALCSLDHFALGPFLLSRPIVIGPLLGAVAGSPESGLWLGLLGEAVFTGVPPTGPQQWDVGLFAGLAAVWAAQAPAGSDPRPYLAAAGLAAFLLALLGRRVDAWARRQVRPWTERAMSGLRRGEGGPLASALVISSALWMFKSFVVFLVFSAIGGGFCHWLFERLTPYLLKSLVHTWTLWTCLAAAVVLSHFAGRVAFKDLLSKKEEA